MRESNGLFNPSNWVYNCTYDEHEGINEYYQHVLTDECISVDEYYQHVLTDECISVDEYKNLKSEDSI